MKNIMGSIISGILLGVSTPSLAVLCDDIFLANSCEYTKAECAAAITCRQEVIASWSPERCISEGAEVQEKVAMQCQECNKRCSDSGLGWLEGTWEGEGSQNYEAEEATWDIRLVVHSGNYSIYYPSLSCSGHWTLNQNDTGVASFTEHITSDPGKRCIGTGAITVGKLGANQLQYRWASGDNIASATLTRRD